MTDNNRRTAWFNAAGRQVELYEMTDGQKVALAAVNARDPQAVMRRLWQVLESLFVHPGDFERLDNAVVSGRVDWDSVEKFYHTVLQHEWPLKVEPTGVYTVPPDQSMREGTTYSLHQDDTIRRTVDATPEPIPDTFRPLSKQYVDSKPRSTDEPY